ncbi:MULTISPECIES: pyridoxamine 5'-phosphate oxidase family protein [unclassified Streptomyces]|uniref:pyridoxamine 5'-phosphate oxidase family protein n=1 Tax=unclassified Streptomyces TaxID=2593676 RepID=UPI002366159A|nr:MULTISPECIES: pyridoxamine 5'-phosphate oxidase family protein [unclassified Streptomyces]MDF3139942.1 pyridoxamine 5'-phosphate oxidase family protein [Streptomyces sp. T21Q-yed]WDF44027.1 pyridoxamine 5'-phosphate oxidase family protein [Streptomyces sp. T12]
MSMSPTIARMVEVSGAEALWLLEGSSLGRLVYTQRELTVVRPARHVFEYGRLVVRTPVPASAVPATATYHVDEIRAVAGTGWTVTVCGPAEVITDPNEGAHYRRTLAGWTHGPHDTLLRIHPKPVTGFRLARPEA